MYIIEIFLSYLLALSVYQNTFQKGYTGLKWLKAYEGEGLERKREAGKLYGRGQEGKDLLETIKPIDSTKLISDRVGIGKTAVSKIKLINTYIFVNYTKDEVRKSLVKC